MVTELALTYLAADRVRLSWASDADDPIYRVYRDGELVLTTRATTYDAAIADGAAPVFDVVDQEDADPSAFPPFAVVQWYQVADAAAYRVEQYVDSAWTMLVTVADDGRGYYQHRTATLADDTTHQFRVVPVSAAGNDGTPTTLSILMVRYPDPPDPAFSYDSGSTTVSIAS